VSAEPAVHADPEPAPLAPVHIRQAQADRLLFAWSTPGGWRYWSAVNNQIVGTWYTAAAFIFFLFGGALALLMRVQLAFPENAFLSA
jgi:cytochrome c oxidase subunit I+III